MTVQDIKGYSDLQVALHWIIAALVVLQTFVTNEGMGALADSMDEEGAALSLWDQILADLHISFGVTIFLLALVRLGVRWRRGAPPLPADEPRIMRLSAHAVHVALYALIILMPITGALAWYFGIEQADQLHSLGENTIIVIVGLHIAGALYQHFIAKTDVLKRMLRSD